MSARKELYRLQLCLSAYLIEEALGTNRDRMVDGLTLPKEHEQAGRLLIKLHLA